MRLLWNFICKYQSLYFANVDPHLLHYHSLLPLVFFLLPDSHPVAFMSYVHIQGSMQYIERMSFLYLYFWNIYQLVGGCSCRSYFWVLYSIGLRDGFCLFCLLLLLVSYYSSRQCSWRFYDTSRISLCFLTIRVICVFPGIWELFFLIL